MSATDSASSGSRLSRFGLYRTIDTRTEEFLRQSRKRQIRSGCICATVSTIITVLLVVVILLIYEYAIAVESNSVQTRKRLIQKNDKIDNPKADSLHRSYFGFDQDYFERMPLLVNSLQDMAETDNTSEQHYLRKSKLLSTTSSLLASTENYRVPTTRNLFHSTPHIRRTSPRPFIFEYKNPAPTPFKKVSNSKSWIESYRNTQRLQNLHEIIEYLRNTINAKFGEVQSAPTTARIEFSGILFEPSTNKNIKSYKPIDLTAQSSNQDIFLSNHKSDPLFTFKPESPGDVNLLADSFLRFSPTAISLLKENKYNNIPMFVPIANRKKYCAGNECLRNVDRRSKMRNANEVTRIDSKTEDPLKTFNLMLDFFPYNHPEYNMKSTPRDVSSIYLTTSRPLIHFRRKSVPNEGQRLLRPMVKRPRFAIIKNEKTNRDIQNDDLLETTEAKNLILRISLLKVNDTIHKHTNSLTRSVQVSDASSNTTGVEDYHVGSSGVVPVEQRTSTSTTTTVMPPTSTIPMTTSSSNKTLEYTTTTIIPFFESTLSTTEIGWPTTPPQFVKFSHEDAKVPKEYQRIWSIKEYQNFEPQFDMSTEINRRTSRTTVEYEESEPSTLSVKLKTDEDITTLSPMLIEETTKSFAEMTTPTYVPQINGHYRSVNFNPPHSWARLNRASMRKRRLEMSVSGYRKPDYMPSYVEIKRNNTEIESNNH